MGKSVHDDVLDQALSYIKNNGDRWCICNAEPTTYLEATVTFELADVDVTAVDYTGPSNGDTNGRKIRMNSKTAVPVDVGGTATHVAIVKTGTSTLLYVTTCTSQVLTLGNTVNLPVWDIEIADPT